MGEWVSGLEVTGGVGEVGDSTVVDGWAVGNQLVQAGKGHDE